MYKCHYNNIRNNTILKSEFNHVSFIVYGQNQGGVWNQGKEVGLTGVGERGGEKMQTNVIEQQCN